MLNQIRLNTIAVLIFAFTFSILLAPWLPISPALPALGVVTILGLVTVDSLGFQGKGINLFLDWFAQKSPAYQERIIRHEAGHFLVAHLLEIPVTGYTLSAWEALKQGQASQGGVIVATPEPLTETLATALVDRYCTVWMAGGVAETLVYGAAEGGSDDLEQLKLTLMRLRLDWKAKQTWAVIQAQHLLQTHWSAYEALVAAMTRRASIAECCQAIEQHC